MMIQIDAKGYGKIYKTVMRNRSIPLLAKTIYAYLCAYAGCGQSAFPKREKILRDLQINKDTFTKHLARLVKDGYIAKERTAAGNRYFILQSVPALEEVPVSLEKKNTNFLVLENVAAHGFGTVPKLVMLDPSLTPQAKAIYAYFASFTGAGTTAFPRRTTIMRELKIGSAGTYYQHFNQLVERGYITVEQQKSGGRFDVCIYRLNSLVPQSGEVDNGMSEKPEHGGKPIGNVDSMSEKALSEKPVSEKAVFQKNGRPDIKNIVTRNSYFMTEQENDHQGNSADFKRKHLSAEKFTQESVNELMRFADLQKEIEAWGGLMRDTLGQLSSLEEERCYRKKMDAILLELLTQLTDALNHAADPDLLIRKIRGPEFEIRFDELLSRWNDIRNPKASIAAALKNL